ncbi:hypothetical protein [Dactylosporangium sp. NPDC005555]|uniref:hypothetical protein n=1 Tax=Dactylosporangium sp. NPDC005555 TaxID=3154889 RepID=UPI0033ABE88F
MSSPDDVPSLTGTQILALVVLMAEARPVTNKELKELAGFALNGESHRKLVSLGLVESHKIGQMLCHELTDKGWAVIKKVRTPAGNRVSAVQTLVTLLTNLDRALAGRYSHAMFFSRTPESTVDVQEQVRVAYDKLAAAPGEWVGLADLRDNLAGVPRADLDAALRFMARLDDVRIIPVANSKALKPRDRAASLRIGVEENHSLSIGAA